eukprot:TRINITY_DN5178_c0_g1_i2.p1 TRINITY_DN5178_c0_g1~~TRINITY_DN5178_c0_g1_i2.p1  ORF type:complete len:150 (+),score=46.30 TRINITY_DN5178_c0_g1_i2:142-591(+)
MSDDPWLIDEKNYYEVLGQEKIIELSTAFYNRVYDDDDEEFYSNFREFFNKSPKEQSIQNQYEFFIQRFGGPPLYSKRKGHPALRMRHRRFKISKKSADRWLYHMREAMKEVNIEGEDVKKALDQFFENVAYFLINHQEEEENSNNNDN